MWPALFATRFVSAKDATKIHVQALQGLTREAAGKHDSKNNDASGTKFKYQLTSFELFTRQMSVPAKTTMELFKQQAVRQLLMNFTSIELQSFTILSGKQVELVSGIFPHEVPHQIFLVLIKTDRVDGVFAKDPFKFENVKVEKVILRQNGLPVMVESQTTNFDNDDAKEVY